MNLAKKGQKAEKDISDIKNVVLIGVWKSKIDIKF
jgi:hypothetical protein